MRSAVGQQAPGAFDLVGVWGERGAGYSICIICSICETICLVISLNIYFYQSAQLGGQGRTLLDHPLRLPRRERAHQGED